MDTPPTEGSEDLPQLVVKQRSLASFCSKAERLYTQWTTARNEEAVATDEEGGEDTESNASLEQLSQITSEAATRFIEYSIAGIDRKHDQRTAISMVNNTITTDWLSNHQDEITHVMDFDSLIGRTQGLPHTTDLQLFPLFMKGYPIDRSLHIGTVPRLSGRKDKKLLYAEEMHIPQIFLAEAGGHRSSVRLFFPALVDWENFPSRYTLSDAERAKVYEILRNAVISTVGRGEEGHWPATYNAERARATKGGSVPADNTGRLIPKGKVARFGKTMLEKIQGLSWGKGAYYFLEIRGTRGSTRHRVRNHQDEFDDFLSCLDLEKIDRDTFWIDVGHEMQAKRTVLWWRSDAHIQLLAEVLGESEEDAFKHVRSKQFYRDEACQLTEVVGFRFTTPSQIHTDRGIAYIQAYCTEKTAAYRPGGRTVTLSYKDLLEPSLKGISKYSRMMEDIHLPAQENKVMGNARIEVRVRLSKVRKDRGYISLNNAKMQSTLYQFTSWDWWAFKNIRISSMIQAIKYWNSSPGTARCHESSISLMTALIYMLNSIVSRPVDMKAESDIHNCITTGSWDITEMPGDNALRHKRYIYGLLFPTDLVAWSEEIPCPHLGVQLKMPEGVYARLFQNRSLYTIQGMLLSTTPREDEDETDHLQAERARGRITNHGPRTTIRHGGPIDDDDVVTLEPHEVQFIPAVQGLRGNMDDVVDRMNAQVSAVLARFYMDVLLRAPNEGKESTSAPYCRLDQDSRKAATAHTLQRRNLAEVWYKVIVKPGSTETWKNNFDNLFPDKAQVLEDERRKSQGIKVAKQGYDQCQYYLDWCATLCTLEKETVERVRETVKRRIDQLLWVPFTAKDKLWRTASLQSRNLPDRANCRLFPKDSVKQSAVIILVHPSKCVEDVGWIFDDDNLLL